MRPVHVAGIGLLGPGMRDWQEARAVLAGTVNWHRTAAVMPVPEALPPAERRRAGTSIRVSMAVGLEAARAAGADCRGLATVFSSSGGDCDNCHALLETLASSDRAVSPTRFHNSVHNAPSGYWGIATHCMAPSTCLCNYDATFTAGLLEAATQALADTRPCMLLAYDAPYPEPLNTLRPIGDLFGVALVLTPSADVSTVARISLDLVEKAPDTMADAGLEALRRSVPSARALPLLQLLARGVSGSCVLEYLGDTGMEVRVDVLS